MSRIGKAPIPYESNVTLKLTDGVISVKGPKGELSTPIPGDIGTEINEGEVRFTCPDDKKETRALYGLTRALVANMVRGVTEGFAKRLEIQGVGYRADIKGKKLNLALGFSHTVELDIPDGLSVSMDGTTNIKIEGIDKQLVGQFAADVRALRPPEPYKGKGVRYAGEHVRRKVGKAGTA